MRNFECNWGFDVSPEGTFLIARQGFGWTVCFDAKTNWSPLFGGKYLHFGSHNFEDITETIRVYLIFLLLLANGM
jgi:hypothetical protein